MRHASIALVCLIGASLPAMGQQLTLEECRQKALSHYPEVARYDLIDQSEQYNLRAASRCWIPQVTLSSQATWQSATASFPDQLRDRMTAQGLDLPGIPKDQYRIQLDIQQTVFDGGSSAAGKKISALEAKEQRLGSDAVLFAVGQRISEIYFSILLLDGNHAIAQETEALLDANRLRLESMHRNGLATRSDLDQIEVERLLLVQQMDQNRASRAQFAAMLETFIGEPLNDRDLVLPEEPGLLSRRNPTPEVRLLDARIATLDAREEMLRAQVRPVISFFAQGYYGNPGLDMFKSMTSRDWTWNAYLGVRMQWNISALFTLGTDKRQLGNARSTLAVQKDVATFNDNLQNERLDSEIVRMRKALQDDEAIVSLRSDIRGAAESQRENGIIDTATLLQRIAEENTARNTRSIHEIELRKNEYELYYHLK